MLQVLLGGPTLDFSVIFTSMWYSILIRQVPNLQNKQFLNWLSRKIAVIWYTVNRYCHIKLYTPWQRIQLSLVLLSQWKETNPQYKYFNFNSSRTSYVIPWKRQTIHSCFRQEECLVRVCAAEVLQSLQSYVLYHYRTPQVKPISIVWPYILYTVFLPCRSCVKEKSAIYFCSRNSIMSICKY